MWVLVAESCPSQLSLSLSRALWLGRVTEDFIAAGLNFFLNLFSAVTFSFILAKLSVRYLFFNPVCFQAYHRISEKTRIEVDMLSELGTLENLATATALAAK
jgi:hypothetical protein